MRAVFDTNVFVSALAIPGGRAASALEAVAGGTIQLVISKAIIHEVVKVLAEKFSRDPEELARVAVFLSDLGEVVSPRTTIHALMDEPDNRILECAVTGRADVIVTGDQQMLKLGEYQGIRILSLKQVLESR